MKKKQVKTLKLTLVKSPIGSLKNQKATLKALGLTKINSTSERPNNPEVQGMVNTVKHLISVEEL